VQLWDDELEALREKIRTEASEFIGSFPNGDPGAGSPRARAEAMREAESRLVLRSDKAADRVVETPNGPLRLREFRPERVLGAMLHIHGGGWMTGEPALTDPLHEALSDHLGLAIVSVDYRLAPENPFPAALEDALAAYGWLLKQGIPAKKIAIGRAHDVFICIFPPFPSGSCIRTHP